jgi:hypothetical protein
MAGTPTLVFEIIEYTEPSRVPVRVIGGYLFVNENAGLNFNI